jgi:hypothetical protein
MTRFRERSQWREPARHRYAEDGGTARGAPLSPRRRGPDQGFSGVLDGAEPPADAEPLPLREPGPRHAGPTAGATVSGPVLDGGPQTTPIPRVRDIRPAPDAWVRPPAGQPRGVEAVPPPTDAERTIPVQPVPGPAPGAGTAMRDRLAGRGTPTARPDGTEPPGPAGRSGAAEAEHRARDTFLVQSEDTFGDTHFFAPPVIGE